MKKYTGLILLVVLFFFFYTPVSAQTSIDWEVSWCNATSLNSIFPGISGTIMKPTDFTSSAVGETVGYTIYLPPSYYTSSKVYPVIYFLHGSLGNECNYVSKNNAGGSPNNVVTLVENGSIPETILVAPNGGAQTNYNGASATMIINELIPHIDSKYKTISSRNGRALEGFSMGGFGTTQFGFANSDKFCSIIPMAGANLNNFESNLSKIKSNGLKVRYVTGALDQSIGINQGYNVIVDRLISEGIMSTSDAIKVPGVGHNQQGLINAEGLNSARFHWSCFDSSSGGNPTATPIPTAPVTATATATPPSTVTSVLEITGDLNSDGRVTSVDYSLFVGVYGQLGCGVRADFNNNCSVDRFD